MRFLVDKSELSYLQINYEMIQVVIKIWLVIYERLKLLSVS